jgi:diaminopimelate epimerase
LTLRVYWRGCGETNCGPYSCAACVLAAAIAVCDSVVESVRM